MLAAAELGWPGGIILILFFIFIQIKEIVKIVQDKDMFLLNFVMKILI